MKKVLVTGHKGFIGQNLCKALYDSGYLLSTFDILDNPTLRPKDLSLDGIDCVIHLGAISSTTETDIHKIMDQNLSWSIELLEECIKNNIHMQFASSASVYGDSFTIMKESDTCRPLNHYAMSKYLFEEYLNKRNNTNTVQVFRYFNVYGPREEHKGSQASPHTQFAKQAKETGIIKIFVNSERYKRDFVHVAKVVDIHLRMLEKNISGVFNIGNGYSRSFLDIARDIALSYDAKIEIIPFPDHLKAHYQHFTCADMSALNRVLGTI